MRVFAPLAMCLVIGSAARCQEPTAIFEDRSLLELLVAEELIGFEHHSNSGLFTVTLLGDRTKSCIRQHYEGAEAQVARHTRPAQAQDRLRTEIRDAFRGERPDTAEQKVLFLEEIEQKSLQLKTLQQELSDLQPKAMAESGLKNAVIASVTRYGTDYIGVRELLSSREVLILLQRVAMVVQAPTGAEPPHAMEPADGPDSDGTSTPPAQ